MWTKFFGFIIIAFIGMMETKGSPKTSADQEILKIKVACPNTIRAGDTLIFKMQLSVEAGWHIYSPDQRNRQMGMTPFTTDFFELPNWIVPLGHATYSKDKLYNGGKVFMGNDNWVSYKFLIKENAPAGDLNLKGELQYQGCDAKMCMPPMTLSFVHKIEILNAQNPMAWGNDGAEAAWQQIAASNTLFADEEAYNSYKLLKPLEMRRYEDDKYQHKAETALAFCQKYPDDPRYIPALLTFISANPLFISKSENEGPDTVRTWNDIDSKAFMRSINVDTARLNRWLNLGNDLVERELKKSTLHDTIKEKLDFAIFARDFKLANSRFSLLPKDTTESSFWTYLESIYWSGFFYRFQKHVSIYAMNAKIGFRAKDFLTGLKSSSPDLAHNYWLQLKDYSSKKLKTTHNSEGIQSLLASCKEHLLMDIIQHGEAPVDFAFQSLQGDKISLKDLRGKVVLIDFWATWCQPCLAEMPHLKKMYDKYKNSGFEIIGICLDEENRRSEVINLLTSNQFEWSQRFEGKGFQSDAMRILFGVNSLPTVWLLDKNGILVHNNARGSILDTLILKYINESI